MDKDKAYAKIDWILNSIEMQDISHQEEMAKVREVLEQLEKDSFDWGKRQGIYYSINLLTAEVEK